MGQTLPAQGAVRPVRADNMIADGTLAEEVASSMPVVDGPVTVPTPDQTEAASKYLADNWAAAVG